jgi:hypothetical protein
MTGAGGLSTTKMRETEITGFLQDQGSVTVILSHRRRAP